MEHSSGVADEPPRHDDASKGDKPPDKTFRRNYALAVINGAFVRAGTGFIHPSTVLPFFIYEATRSSFMVGILTSIVGASIMWPQLYLSSLIEHRPRKLPFYIYTTVGRFAFAILMVASIWLTAVWPWRVTIPVFLVAYFLYRSCLGCGALVFYDVLGRTIGSRRIGGIMAYRAFFGDILVVLASLLLIQPILKGVAFPVNYGILAICGVAVAGTGWVAFCMCHEPIEHAPPRRRGLRQTMAAGARHLLEDRDYKLLLALRLAMRFNALALFFLAPYGVERLGVLSMAGVFTAVLSGSRMLSSLLWGWMSDRKGNRVCLAFSGLLYSAGAVFALAAPFAPQGLVSPTLAAALGLDARLFLCLLALVCFGAAQQGTIIGVNALTIACSPRNRRPSYLAFLNTVTFPATFLPALAGALFGGSGAPLDNIYIVVFFSGLASLFIALAFRERRRA